MSDNLIEGHAIVFRASASNTGVVTVQREGRVVTMIKDGKPIKAGDIEPGQTISINRETGEIEEV